MTFYNATISGRVFSDVNGDNTENASPTGYEPGIEGQTVYLLNSSGNVIQTTTTGASGSYSFDGLSSGNYSVQFPTSIDGQSLVEQDVGTWLDDSDADVGTGITQSFFLSTGENKTNVDAGYNGNPMPDGVVDGEDTGETMVLGYDDGNAPTDNGGDLITTGDDVIFGNGGDDIIDGDAGDDIIYGDDGNQSGGSTEVGVASEGGVATLLVWDAGTLSYSGGNPFIDGTSGLSDSSVSGCTMTFGDNTTPVAVTWTRARSSTFTRLS